MNIHDHICLTGCVPYYFYDTNLRISWNFFEAHHGKGCVDGIGGIVKRTVFKKVLSNHVGIQGPEHFANYANSILNKIDVIFVEKVDYSLHEECRLNAKEVAGTLKVHYVLREKLLTPGHFKLKFFNTTASGKLIAEKSYDTTNALGTWGNGDYTIQLSSA